MNVGILDHDEDDGEGEENEEEELGELGVTVDEGRVLLYGSIDGKIDRLLELRTLARNATNLEEISSVITQLGEEFSAPYSTT